MNMPAWKKRGEWGGIVLLLCPLLLVAGADQVRTAGRSPVGNGEEGSQAVRRVIVAEGAGGQMMGDAIGGREGSGQLVLRDVRVSEEPILISESERFRMEAAVELVATETEAAEGAQAQPALAGEPTPPLAFSLSQNYPNPFNPSTAIDFAVPAEGLRGTSLRVYDIRGRLVRTLVEEGLSPGLYRIHWDAKDDRGEALSSGIYLYRLGQGEKVLTKKMTLVR